MNKSISRLVPIISAVIFMSTGCAKQDVVKKDEPLVSSGAKPTATVPSEPAAPTAKLQSKPIAIAQADATSAKNGEQNKSGRLNETAVAGGMQNAFEKIYFNFDSAELSSASRKSLIRNFEILKQNQMSKLRIEGHCDERGSDEYNLALGERRAKAAARYLTTLGIPPERIPTISYGKEKPAVPGSNEEAWSKNRRDEFVIYQ